MTPRVVFVVSRYGDGVVASTAFAPRYPEERLFYELASILCTLANGAEVAVFVDVERVTKIAVTPVLRRAAASYVRTVQVAIARKVAA